MKRLLVAGALLAVAGCDRGGGPETATVTDGTYRVLSVTEEVDGCGIGPGADVGDTVSVIQDGDEIAIGVIDGTINGNNIDAPDPNPDEMEFEDGNGACAMERRNDYRGEIEDDEAFYLVDEDTVDVSGSNTTTCPYVECESRFRYQFLLN